MAKILIINDQESSLDSLLNFFAGEGFETEGCKSGTEAYEILHNEYCDIIITDLHIGEFDRKALIRNLRDTSPDSEVIFIDNIDSISRSAVDLKNGAYGFVSRPFEYEEIMLIVERALEKKDMAVKIQLLENELKEKYKFDGTIGSSPEILNALKTVIKVSNTDSTVMIRGERGTGKEIIARSLHYNSLRCDEVLLHYICGSNITRVNKSSVEQEVYSFESESPIEAILEKADHGTLIIDNISRMSIENQEKLLDYMKAKINRNGNGSNGKKLNARIIILTDKDLRKDVRNNNFNLELSNILEGISIYIPPLRDRKEDIEVLINYFLKIYADRLKKPEIKITTDALSILREYDWPGNLMELETILERSISLCTDNTIELVNLPQDINRNRRIQINSALEKDYSLAELEKDYILEVLDQKSWNKTRAAEKLGITRATLLNKLKLYENGKKVSA